MNDNERDSTILALLPTIALMHRYIEGQILEPISMRLPAQVIGQCVGNIKILYVMGYIENILVKTPI